MITPINTLSPSVKRLLTAAFVGAAALSWGQDTPAPAATPAAPAITAPDRVLPVADPASPAAATLGGVLSGNSTAVSAIQRQEYTQREKLLTEITERVQTAEQRVAVLQQKNAGLSGDNQKTAAKALADYTQAKAKLQTTIEASRGAQAPLWERTRATLATDYAFFVAAAAAVELASPTT